ncbi:hypothetical protein BH09SUM1_BH09SUM1_09480 [soil metagenome]
MSTQTQTIIVLAIVALAAAYLGRTLWKTLYAKKTGCGCGSDKGCGKAAEILRKR